MVYIYGDYESYYTYAMEYSFYLCMNDMIQMKIMSFYTRIFGKNCKYKMHQKYCTNNSIHNFKLTNTVQKSQIIEILKEEAFLHSDKNQASLEHFLPLKNISEVDTLTHHTLLLTGSKTLIIY